MLKTTNKESSLKIYPTVTSGNLTIEIGSIPANVKIFDLSGKLIDRKTQYAIVEELDLSAQESGVYVVNVETEDDLLTAKIVKD